MKRPGRLEITTRIGCKCNCVYCPQKLLLTKYFHRAGICNPPQVMTMDTFQTCMDKLPKGTRIDFSGMAEPWLNENCTQMVRYAHKKNYPIAIYSTLIGMAQEDFDQIKDIPCEEFVVHIPDDQGNAQIDVSEQYLILFEQAMAYERPDGKKLVTGVSCHADIHPAIKDAVPKDSKLITQIHNRAGNLEDAHVISKTNQGEIVCINCETQLHHNVLLPDGTVLLCCMDYGMQHTLGNLLKQSYDEIVQSEEALRIRQGLKDDTADILCRNCVNARNISELYDEFARYQDWTKHLLVSDVERQKDLNVYKSWVKNLQKQKEEFEAEYKDWVKNLETENANLQALNNIATERVNRALDQNIRLEQTCSALEQRLESLSKSPFFKLADKTKK